MLKINDFFKLLFLLVNEYTKEAGVRSLERKLAAVCRSVAVRVAESSEDTLPYIINADHIEDILGVSRFLMNYSSIIIVIIRHHPLII